MKKKPVHFVESCAGTICGTEGDIEYTYSTRRVTCKSCKRILERQKEAKRVTHMLMRSLMQTLCGRENLDKVKVTEKRSEVTCKKCSQFMKGVAMDPYEGRCGLKPIKHPRNGDTHRLQIDGFDIPGALIDANFTTTEWAEILGFYPEYLASCKTFRIMPLRRLDYTLLICNTLAANNCRPGRSARDWFWRIADHFGRAWFNDHVLGDVK
jgi:hypothetical protein